MTLSAFDGQSISDLDSASGRHLKQNRTTPQKKRFTAAVFRGLHKHLLRPDLGPPQSKRDIRGKTGDCFQSKGASFHYKELDGLAASLFRPLVSHLDRSLAHKIHEAGFRLGFHIGKRIFRIFSSRIFGLCCGIPCSCYFRHERVVLPESKSSLEELEIGKCFIGYDCGARAEEKPDRIELQVFYCNIRAPWGGTCFAGYFVTMEIRDDICWETNYLLFLPLSFLKAA